MPPCTPKYISNQYTICNTRIVVHAYILFRFDCVSIEIFLLSLNLIELTASIISIQIENAVKTQNSL